MSGGYFDYKQHDIHDIVESLERVVNSVHEGTVDLGGYRMQLSDRTVDVFREALHHLKLAELYVHRIDWLLSEDDSEESFFERLREELINN